ncbi:MAG TPA: hypothetical protein VE990_00325, partial [Acidimicrobiales bacterium]|nr:hypothetical protein [Acidimicrobiales bacterium]
VGASAGAGGTVSAGGGGGAGGSTVGGATGSVTAPVATTDPYCDQATGREMVPSLYAPPCVPPYDGNNGGATYNGVTATTINVAIPQTNNQAEAKALAAAANDTDTQQQVDQQRNDDFDLFEHHYQTYGRKVKWAYYTSSYNSGDSLAAQNAECQADATKVAEQMHAFASWGDCGTNAYENTLVKDGVLCFCTTTIPASYYLQWAPYVWGNGLPDETAGYDMRAEVLCNNLVPYAPQYAGEQDLNTPIKKQRVFGLIWPGASSLDDTDIYRGGAAYFAGLMQKCGANLKDDVSFPLIDPNGPADAQTLMSKFKNDGITTVIFVGDPIDPIYLTNAATKQAYFPEWFDSGSALIDTTHFGRLYDPNQWKHSFGISFLADRVPPTENDAYNMYEWQFHRAPPAQDGYGVMWPFPFWLFTGIQLAGPKLTPYTLQCGQPPYTTTTHTGPGDSSNGVPCVGKTYPGLFGYFGPSDWQSRVTNALEGWGDKFWPYDYYNIINDGTLIWWNGSASGPDETNNQGVGEQEFMLGGKRYVYGQFPKGNLPWFSTTSNPGPVTIFSSLPAPDVPPNYPNKCYYLCNSPGY